MNALVDAVAIVILSAKCHVSELFCQRNVHEANQGRRGLIDPEAILRTKRNLSRRMAGVLPIFKHSSNTIICRDMQQ